jgi:hypothetical protein
MNTRLCRAAALLGIVATAAVSGAQTLGDAARLAREKRQASGGSAVKLDQRDVDPRLAAQEVLDYEVTAERWRRFLAADLWVTQALQKDQALYDRLAASKLASARALERFLTREPGMIAALKAAGSNPHDYAFTQIALTVAMIFRADPKGDEILPQLPPATQANIAWTKEHEREIQEIQGRALQLKARMDKQ